MPAAESHSLDTEAIRKRYREERAKRITAERDSFIDLHGQFTEYLDDPHTPRVDRAPLHDDVDAVIIGGGLGGLLIGASLRQAGVERIRVVETGGDFGGTWYWNRYPGAQCDVDSFIYLPLLEELGYVPKEHYSYQPEIFEHAQRIGRHFDLYRDACFQTHVTGLTWDAPAQRWIVRTDRGDAMLARFVCVATGPLSRPKLPAIPGITTFEGELFHTSRWNYAYTGGTTNGELTGLADKRVGVIGTGATGIQVVPRVAQCASHLTVFQRTPSTVGHRGNRPTDDGWDAGLEPGWQRELMENFSNVIAGDDIPDRIRDGWTRAVQQIYRDPAVLALPPDERPAAIELADFKLCEGMRARIDEMVHDKRTADTLKPWYAYYCKRPCFHDEYLLAFNRPNVELIDTDGRGIEEVTPDGVISGGVKYALDCVIFATGFEAGSADRRPAEFEVHGLDDVTLREKWAEGMSSLHGMMSRGFPNLFFTPGAFSPALYSQSVRSANYTHALVEVADQIAHIVAQCRATGASSFEVSARAEAEWVETVAGSAAAAIGFRGGLDFQKQCTPSYLNNEGKPDQVRDRDRAYPGTPKQFFALLADWRATGGLPGLELTR